MAIKSIALSQDYSDNYDSENKQLEKEVQSIVKMCQAFAHSNPEELKSREVYLGPSKFGKTIIFDLDETLISAKTQLVLAEKYDVLVDLD